MSNTPSWVMTYDSLTAIVLQYLERSDAAVTNAIPTFITLAEFEIAQEIKTLGQLQVVTSNVSANNPILQKPALWRKTVSFNITDTSGNQDPVLKRSYEYCVNYGQNSSGPSQPQFYSDVDWDHWYLSPTPDQGYSFQALYYQRIPPLSSTNQTNWLTQNSPNTLLYGTLLQAMQFLKNDQRTIFQQKYSESIAALKEEDQIRIADRQAINPDS